MPCFCYVIHFLEMQNLSQHMNYHDFQAFVQIRTQHTNDKMLKRFSPVQSNKTFQKQGKIKGTMEETNTIIKLKTTFYILFLKISVTQKYQTNQSSFGFMNFLFFELLCPFSTSLLKEVLRSELSSPYFCETPFALLFDANFLPTVLFNEFCE